MLEEIAVSKGIRPDYEKYLSNFLNFAAANKLQMETLAEIDVAFVQFYDALFLDGEGHHVAEKTFAAWMDSFPDFNRKGALKLPRESRARTSFRKHAPPLSRDPFDLSICSGLAETMVAVSGRKDFAIYLCTLFVGYLRPGEGLSLVGQQILPAVSNDPASPLSHPSLHLAPRELLTPGKTFTWDDTILLDQVNFKWVGELLVTLAREKGASGRIFSFTNDEVRLCFEKAVHLLGLPEDSVLYQLRHSGASHDLIHHHREFANVMTRGRWVTETSVRRYAKQGRVQRLLAGLPLASRAFRETSIQKIEDVVQGRFLARTVA